MQKENKGFFFRPDPSFARDIPDTAALLSGRRFVRIAIALLAIAVFCCCAGAWFLYRISKDLPTPQQIQNIAQPLSTKVFDRSGVLIHEFSTERRAFVPLDRIPADLQNAVIAIEDRRFYSHGGINLQRIIGAIFINIVRREYAQGASTITQQLARNLYLTADQSIVRKLREMLTAIQLESCYTKQEILELYLNQVYLGGGVWGVGAASEQYFMKPVGKLDLNECATLAGVIQQPERYRPDRQKNLSRLTARRNAVLAAMKETGAISKASFASVKNEPVPAHPAQERAAVGGYFLEMVRKYVSDKFGDDQLYNGGFAIHTTLDRDGQYAAERAADSAIAGLQRRLNGIFLDSSRAYRHLKIKREVFLKNFDSLYSLRAEEYDALPDSVRLRQAQIAVVALDAETGGIRTLIGGRSFAESKFNRVTMARRQPGSSFKPVIYAAAMEHDFTPASVVLDQPMTLETPSGEWRPENYDRVFNGPITVRRALALSVNIVAIQVLMKVGPDVVVDYARRLGFKGNIQPVPSLAIGSCEVTPMELARAFQIFANKGISATPYFIEKITDKNGRVVDQHVPDDKEVLSPQTSYLMCSLLQSVVCCGTASSIPRLGFTRPAAGKTGTTNNYSDAWFTGFTPQNVCCVWTGTDEQRTLGSGVTGSLVAVPVWVPIMVALHKNLPIKDFEMPSGIKSEKLCDESHLIANDFCPKQKYDYFLTESVIDTC
ncbi:MAG: PBP1A family penicillin-binding protein, partial [Chitinispirillaceae bacterium]|nr:PBP1A family penicillin-binding protein [Chitinispirillaceae bacterium]